MQSKVLNKLYWNVGKTAFRALSWSPKANPEEILALSSPRWVILKNIPSFLWKFIPQIVEPLGKFIRMDENPHLVPHMDARVLISILPRINLPNSLQLNIIKDVFSCSLEFLGGLNACFLYKHEGHVRKNCPILKKNASAMDTSKPNSASNSHSVPSTQPAMKSAPASHPESPTLTSIPLPPPSVMTPPPQPLNTTSPAISEDGYQVVMNSKKRRRKNGQQLVLNKGGASVKPPLLNLPHTPSKVKSIINSFESPHGCPGSVVIGDGSTSISEKIEVTLCNDSASGSNKDLPACSSMAQVTSAGTIIARNSVFCSSNMLPPQEPCLEVTPSSAELEEPLPGSICLEEDASGDDFEIQTDGTSKPTRRGRPMGFKNKNNTAKKKDKDSLACNSSFLAAEGL